MHRYTAGPSESSAPERQRWPHDFGHRKMRCAPDRCASAGPQAYLHRQAPPARDPCTTPATLLGDYPRTFSSVLLQRVPGLRLLREPRASTILRSAPAPR